MSFIQFWQAVVYGIVQGITEFLPVSSTAHLTLIPKFFNWPNGGMSFDVALHLGTAFAIIVFFFRRWVQLIAAGFTKPKSPDGKLFWIIVVSTVPASIVGVLLNDKISFLQENTLIIGIMLIVMGFILWAADYIGRKEIKSLENIKAKNGLIVGISQCFAIIPGVSRSGVTITAGRFMGITRKTAAEFTFLLSAPIVLGDALYHLLKLHSDAAASADLSQIGGTAAMVVGIVVSAIVGLISIKFLLDFLKKQSLLVFSVYRFILGAVVIILAITGAIR